MKVTRFIIKSISSAVLLISFGNVFAADIKCPSSDIIKNTIFKSATKSDSGNVWNLVSTNFDYAGNQFNVDLQLYDIIRTKNKSIALVEGQHFFKQASLYAEPYRTNPDPGGIQYIHCKYWEGQGGYYVEATTPPYPYPLS